MREINWLINGVYLLVSYYWTLNWTKLFLYVFVVVVFSVSVSFDVASNFTHIHICSMEQAFLQGTPGLLTL